MALSFPRQMLNYGIGAQRFELQRVDYVSPRVDGRIAAVTSGWSLWTATWSFTGMSEERSQAWRAWVASLRGPQRLFYGADLLRREPLHGLGGFDGDADAWSVGTDRDVLTLTGLPSGFRLSPGDYVGFRWGDTKRAMVRVLETSTGSTAVVTVEPAVPNVVPADAVAYLANPVCLMRLLPDTELGEIGLERSLTGRVVAVQELLP
jgi:hypothetical protein